MRVITKLLAATVLVAGLISATAATAFPAQTRFGVYVLSEADAGSAPVDTLYRNEAVEVERCEGLFCYVTSADGAGWVRISALEQN